MRELPPIKEDSDDYDTLEERLRALWRKELYAPLMRLLDYPLKMLNAASMDSLIEALKSGRITFNRGIFSGRFNATISKELKELGARWDRKTSTFRISKVDLPREITETISASADQFARKIEKIDKHLAQILPEEIADKLKAEKLFDSSLWKVERLFTENVKKITVMPELTKEQRAKIAREWEENMQRYVKDWTRDEIVSLRSRMKKTILAGHRYESAVKTIEKSFNVSLNKAKFLARQETGLLMAKFKETRYTEAGIMEYKWGCVAGSKNHPVRPWHKALEGKIFRWDDPPVTTQPGTAVRRNNPGEDFNCRCFARPIVRSK